MTMMWEAETTIIRLTAVALIFGLLSGRRDRSHRSVTLSALAVVACAVAHVMRGGVEGLVSPLGGAAVAAAAASVPALRGMIGRRVTAASIAAGSVLGPIGAAVALGIAAALHLLARLVEAGGVPFADRFEIDIPEDEPRIGGSVLTMIERGRLPGGSGRAPATVGGAGAPVPRLPAVPLRVSLAVAVLAMLMTGAFV